MLIPTLTSNWRNPRPPGAVQGAPPAILLAALRAHSELAELRAGDLRFTREEADEFLNGRLSLGLVPEDVDGLVERTEGWPAGLYLTALSLSRDADRHDFVNRFGASSASKGSTSASSTRGGLTRATGLRAM
jgi:hypothetical protein